MNIGDYLAQKLNELDLTQSEFARRAGLTSGPVSKWISRGGRPDMESCLKMAAFFKEDPVKILKLAGRDDLVQIYQKFNPQYVQANVSEEDLYENEIHRQLHRGLQRVLERGMEHRDDVELGIELVRHSLNALLRSENLFRSLVETAHVVAWEASAEDLHFTYVGPQAERVLGYPREEWYRPGFWHLQLHPDDRDRAFQFRMSAARERRSYELEYRMMTKENQIRWFQDVGTIVPDSSPRMMQGFLFDITPRKEVEEELRQSEERYRSLVELCPDAIVVHRNAEILYVNQAAVALHGAKTAEQLVGRLVFEFVRSEDLAQVRERIRRNVEDGATMPLIEQEVIPLSGKPILVEVAAAPIMYGGSPAVQSILRKISHRRMTSGRKGKLKEGTSTVELPAESR